MKSFRKIIILSAICLFIIYSGTTAVVSYVISWNLVKDEMYALNEKRMNSLLDYFDGFFLDAEVLLRTYATEKRMLQLIEQQRSADSAREMSETIVSLSAQLRSMVSSQKAFSCILLDTPQCMIMRSGDYNLNKEL